MYVCMYALTGVRDTTEVLSALQSVVAELEDVDAWLNEQIDHIAEVQANLHLIEDESGTLETTWKNLNELQTVVVCICMYCMYVLYVCAFLLIQHYLMEDYYDVFKTFSVCMYVCMYVCALET